MFSNSVFGDNKPKEIEIPRDCDVIFVSDAFSHQYLGGAELTTDAIIDGSSDNVFRLNSQHVNLKTLSAGVDKFWVFGNFSQMDINLIPTIVANIDYAIAEYDYKYCRYRSPEKHKIAENIDCNCQNETQGKAVSSFYYGAEILFWMSEKQKEKYLENFPFLESKNNFVLSSAFSTETLDSIRKLRETTSQRSEKWIIVGSTSWIKGVPDAENYCKENDLDYEVVWKLPYDKMLEKMSQSKGLIFLPPGGDTCPRIVIEAKLLGCQLLLNKNVQHMSEEWFNKDIDEVESYLMGVPERFWSKITAIRTRQPTISGYTTTKDCISQDYPYEECIASLLGFCDQVVAVDGGSTDGTWERLVEMSKSNERLLVEQKKRDWNHKRFAVFDGLQKAYSRSLCTGDFCWQQDSDEIVHEDDYKKIKKLVKQLPKSMNLLAIPLVEYWGSSEKVRADINPWKWRLSRNRRHITHGIPKNLRKYDSDGNLHSLPGTDGCDYIDAETFEVIPCTTFYTEDAHKARIAALGGNKNALEAYENWFNNVISQLPTIHHYSWFNIKRKINTYKNYWSQHWQSLYDIVQDDTVENNMFFDKTWVDVTEEDIEKLSTKLSDELGGWVFHRKVDFSSPTPHIDCESSVPSVMDEWIKRNGK